MAALNPMVDYLALSGYNSVVNLFDYQQVDFASSRESSTPVYLSHTSSTSMAHSSMWIQCLTSFLALLSACHPTTQSMTLVHVPCPSCYSFPTPAQPQMTHLPFCWQLTCSHGQPSLHLLPFLVLITCSTLPIAELCHIHRVMAYNMPLDLRKWEAPWKDGADNPDEPYLLKKSLPPSHMEKHAFSDVVFMLFILFLPLCSSESEPAKPTSA